MDARRLVLFILLALGLLFVWDKYMTPPQKIQIVNTPISSNTSSNKQIVSDTGFMLPQAQIITVKTDLFKVQISTIGGDLRSMDLSMHSNTDDKEQPYQLFLNEKDRLFIAQTGLLDSTQKVALPTRDTVYSTDKLDYTLTPEQNEIHVNLKYSENNGITIVKTYTFKRNSYQIGVAYQIINNTSQALNGVSAYWRLLRDELAPKGETKLVHTFTGPAYYTADTKFNTISFDKIIKGTAEYPSEINNGWVGFIQHYFTAVWMLNSYTGNSVCSNGVQCRLSFSSVEDKLASAGLLTDLPSIAPHSTYVISVPLYAGPEEYSILTATAPGMELTKDYGYVHIFATPLFWLLVKIQELVKNWGLAIILLTVLVKLVLYPLTNASYKSMGKMKALAPKIERLKAQYGDDRVKMQKAMMEMYKSEKVNPIGGCLPMLLQIPVFIGLYWALLSSVELRQASFLWVHDLSRPDPYYILPVILAITMYLQTFLNPPPTDPIQAKMMKIMPVAFSIMFFFFPAGLVVYWLVNNILTMAQQWYVNKHIHLSTEKN